MNEKKNNENEWNDNDNEMIMMMIMKKIMKWCEEIMK